MTQRGRKTNSRSMDNNGGNALFTMGLITVVALLIVGWVMTQGGWQPFADRGEGIINLPFDSSQQPNQNTTVMQPTPTPQPNLDPNTLLAPSLGSDNPLERIEMEELTRRFQEQIQKQQESYDQQIEELRRRHQQELNKTQQELQELKTQFRLMEMENKRLQGE